MHSDNWPEFELGWLPASADEITIVPASMTWEVADTYRARDVTTEWICVSDEGVVPLEKTR